jgi:hypothetical protein
MIPGSTLPVGTDDPINRRILEQSEDRVQGFHERPFDQIANQAGLDLATVLERIAAMLQAGTIRRVRQTLLATNLAQGALVAWRVPEEKLNDAFDWMHANDPFTGHVVVRSTDAPIRGARYRLWTTLKVPQGYCMSRHAQHLCRMTGAIDFRLMPARKVFALGVGHMRRRGLEIGAKADVPAEPNDVHIVELSDLDWQVLTHLKRELSPEEIRPDVWKLRAREAGVSHEQFVQVARSLARRNVIGRFSTFLEHVKPTIAGERVTRFNALFHWAVPPGREVDAGMQVARFHIMTHAYWREAGEEFGNVNIMGVAHGTDRDRVLAHKQAIDDHLKSEGIPVTYTNVFWGGRSEIKPSEISPVEYVAWARSQGVNPDDLRL